MAEFGESVVVKYLTNKGFEVSHIQENTTHKTPDKAVYKNGELVFYLEEKTIDYDDFEGSKDDNTYSKLGRLTKNAAKQLKTVNPNHDVPNVIAFVNLDRGMKDSHDLYIALTGCAFTEDHGRIKIHTPRQEVKDVLGDVDMWLWFNGEVYENRMFGSNEKFTEKLISLFDEQNEKQQ